MASLYLKKSILTKEEIKDSYKDLFLDGENIKYVFEIDDSDGKTSYISSKFKDDIVSINMSENSIKSEKFCVITDKRMLYIYDDFYCYKDISGHFKKDDSVSSVYVDSKSLSKIVSKVSYAINPVSKEDESRIYLGDMKLVFRDSEFLKKDGKIIELYKFFIQYL